ncbi:MAG: hypothetical protein A2148_04865 [Chloroflexi bacterium RBG_16_68_14]|nr:MAG: hypothetical protein A2148_04865 [Chloroflexi bacterium RBG_16_68_14]
MARAVSVSDERRVASTGEVTASFMFAYIAAIALMAALILWGGLWDWMANTRLLAWLLDAGVIALTDEDQGLIAGVTDAEFYIKSQEPVVWGLVAAVAGMFVSITLLKALQFHGIAQFAGSRANIWQHARAYIYGDGLGKLLPFEFGTATTMASLEAQGTPMSRAGLAIFVGELFTLFEIVVFGLLALYLVGWSAWLYTLLWALLIMGACYFFARRGRSGIFSTVRGGGWGAAWHVIKVLSQRPALLVGLALLSVGSYYLYDIAGYVIVQAYTSESVILHVSTSQLLLAVVSASMARFIQITPGGMGQYEWGFAAALFASGIAAPEAMTIAVLFNFIRYVAQLLLLLVVRLFFGAEASVRQIMDQFRGIQPEPQAAS